MGLKLYRKINLKGEFLEKEKNGIRYGNPLNNVQYLCTYKLNKYILQGKQVIFRIRKEFQCNLYKQIGENYKKINI